MDVSDRHLASRHLSGLHRPAEATNDFGRHCEVLAQAQPKEALAVALEDDTALMGHLFARGLVDAQFKQLIALAQEQLN
jgi:hypothetical protein